MESYRQNLASRHPTANVLLVPHGTFDTEKRDVRPSGDRPLQIDTMSKLGTYERLETLIEAFRDLRNRPGLGALELVIGGGDHPNTQGYMASVAASCAEDPGITFHGHVAEGDIADFFMQASVSVFDSS